MFTCNPYVPSFIPFLFLFPVPDIIGLQSKVIYVQKVLMAQKTDEECLWAGLPVQVPRIAQMFFGVAVQTTVGNGTLTKFWLDC